MFRNQLCLAAIVASFVFVFGTTNVEARHCGSHHKSHGCCKVSDHGCGHRVHRRHAKGCHQASCVAPSACCQPNQRVAAHSPPTMVRKCPTPNWRRSLPMLRLPLRPKQLMIKRNIHPHDDRLGRF